MELRPGDRLSFVAADLTNDAGWPEAVAGCDYVLHVASPLPERVPKDENELIVPAREGTLRVLRASRDAGVKRVVLTSSFAAIGYGHKQRNEPFTERDWTDPNCDDVLPYTKSKTLAEHAAWNFMAAEGGNLELSVINPVGVFGPVLGPDYSASILIVQRMMDGAMPGAPRLYFGIVDVRDVADLHIRAMTHPAAKGERFLAVAGDSHVDAGNREGAEEPHGRVCQKSADTRVAQLDGAACRHKRSCGKADPARARQKEERHQRKGQASPGLGAAFQRRSHRRHRRKPGTPGSSEEQRKKSCLVSSIGS